MHVQGIATASKAFLSKLSLSDERLQPKLIELRNDAGRFADIFRNVVGSHGGVYWFFLPDGTVFDIGKSDTNVWGRICEQTRVASWRGDPLAAWENTIGDGWGFPNSRHLTSGTAKASTREAIMKGEFGVGWITFEPGYMATLVEVYLQTLCRAADGILPEFCFKIG